MAITRDDAYWAHIRSLVDAAPPFTERQRDRLAVLFRPHVAAVHHERTAKRSTRRREAVAR